MTGAAHTSRTGAAMPTATCIAACTVADTAPLSTTNSADAGSASPSIHITVRCSGQTRPRRDSYAAATAYVSAATANGASRATATAGLDAP